MSRTVRIASLQLPAVVEKLPPAERQDANLADALEMIERQVNSPSDLIVLPESFNVWGVAAGHYRELAEPLPHDDGPPAPEAGVLSALGRLARARRTYVVAPVVARTGERLRNTSVLLDRQGHIAGVYDKVHLTTPEYEWGITPGRAFPTFACDFGRIGMMICFDLSFPESARCLALNGAELIAFSTMQSYYGELSWETTVRSRAIDNAVWLAISNYGYAPDQPWMPGMIIGGTGVVAPAGHSVAGLGRQIGVAQAVIDLDQARWVRSFGVAGEANYREQMLRHRRPEAYGALGDARLHPGLSVARRPAVGD